MRFEIPVRAPADLLLYEGLPALEPALDALGSAALLIGGLTTAAWLTNRPVGLPVRATRDVDLGIDRLALGVAGERLRVGALLVDQNFAPGFGGEEFRFSYATSAGPFIVDLLVASGASRETPPVLEPGIATLAAPGLRYAIDRGHVPIDLVLRGDETRSFRLHGIQLDAAFVMKAALVAGGLRTRADKRIVDTVDAVMLAAACAADLDAMAALSTHAGKSEPKKALAWLSSELANPRTRAARRVAEHTGDPEDAQWAVDVARRFADALQRARSR